MMILNYYKIHPWTIIWNHCIGTDKHSQVSQALLKYYFCHSTVAHDYAVWVKYLVFSNFGSLGSY